MPAILSPTLPLSLRRTALACESSSLPAPCSAWRARASPERDSASLSPWLTHSLLRNLVQLGLERSTLGLGAPNTLPLHDHVPVRDNGTHRPPKTSQLTVIAEADRQPPH